MVNDENRDILFTSQGSPGKLSHFKTPREPLSSRMSPTRSRSRYSSPYRTQSLPSQDPEPSLPLLNVVIVGDPLCGKSSLVLTYLSQRPTMAKSSLLLETYQKTVHFNNCKSVRLQFWDFPGGDTFDRFRPLGYANAKGALICFQLSKFESLQNVKVRWIPELDQHCHLAQRILVGLGSELRLDPEKRHILPSKPYCQQFASNLGCTYMECSLSSNRSYTKVFESMAMMLKEDKKEAPLGSLLSVSKARVEIGAESHLNPRHTSYSRRKHRCTIM